LHRSKIAKIGSLAYRKARKCFAPQQSEEARMGLAHRSGGAWGSAPLKGGKK